MVKKLDGDEFEPDETAGEFEYFVADRLEYKGKLYKLIWLFEKNQIYIGVVNAYRRI
ncbi:MAG: hypothetical protein KA715_00790 [Xanthomonadaceae bacterium]|nr:hypothetical protein [Xanthomonadaceae bacterium]